METNVNLCLYLYIYAQKNLKTHIHTPREKLELGKFKTTPTHGPKVSNIKIK